MLFLKALTNHYWQRLSAALRLTEKLMAMAEAFIEISGMLMAGIVPRTEPWRFPGPFRESFIVRRSRARMDACLRRRVERLTPALVVAAAAVPR